MHFPSTELTAHAIVREALAELVDHDEKDAERVAKYSDLLETKQLK